MDEIDPLSSEVHKKNIHAAFLSKFSLHLGYSLFLAFGKVRGFILT